MALAPQLEHDAASLGRSGRTVWYSHAAMKRCWARSVGGCSSKLSREHLFSEAIFRGPIVVSGYPWCNGEEKVVGPAALTKKILCVAHNGASGSLDQEAASFFHEVSAAAPILLSRRASPETLWEPSETVVNGPVIERWFLKTAINLSLAGRSDLRWYPTDSALTDVPEALVRVVYGQRSLSPPQGLYSVAIVGVPHQYDDSLSFAPVVKSGSHIVGGTFSFRGLNYLLWLEDRQPPRSALRSEWANPELHFHLAGWDFFVAGRPSHRITYRW